MPESGWGHGEQPKGPPRHPWVPSPPGHPKGRTRQAPGPRLRSCPFLFSTNYFPHLFRASSIKKKPHSVSPEQLKLRARDPHGPRDGAALHRPEVQKLSGPGPAPSPRGIRASRGSRETPTSPKPRSWERPASSAPQNGRVPLEPGLPRRCRRPSASAAGSAPAPALRQLHLPLLLSFLAQKKPSRLRSPKAWSCRVAPRDAVLAEAPSGRPRYGWVLGSRGREKWQKISIELKKVVPGMGWDGMG